MRKWRKLKSRINSESFGDFFMFVIAVGSLMIILTDKHLRNMFFGTLFRIFIRVLLFEKLLPAIVFIMDSS